MILGDNPARHGFLLRNLVLTELSGHAPPLPPAWERGRELKISEKVFAGGVERFRSFNFGGGGEGHIILK